MKNEILFFEKQKFKQWWIWLFLVLINALFLFAVFYQIILEKNLGNNSISNVGLVTTTCITVFTTVLFLSFRLETQVKNDGIYVRFFPFHLKFKRFPWEVLTKTYVRTYSPVLEYGGWGFRYGGMKKGSAFNVSGNKGLQLEFTDNKKLLIGTNQPEELERVLLQIQKIKQD